MNAFFTSLRVLILMTFVLGGLYPASVFVVGKFLFPKESKGRLIKVNDHLVGSELIGQNFTKDNYFWGRPSAVDYHSAVGGASNLSVTSKVLHEQVEERIKLLGIDAPMELLYKSASGLDPHISVEGARFQKKRVSLARNISEEALEKYIQEATEDRFLGFMGQPRVNVLKLNLSLESR